MDVQDVMRKALNDSHDGNDQIFASLQDSYPIDFSWARRWRQN